MSKAVKGVSGYLSLNSTRSIYYMTYPKAGRCPNVEILKGKSDVRVGFAHDTSINHHIFNMLFLPWNMNLFTEFPHQLQTYRYDRHELVCSAGKNMSLKKTSVLNRKVRLVKIARVLRIANMEAAQFQTFFLRRGGADLLMMEWWNRLGRNVGKFPLYTPQHSFHIWILYMWYISTIYWARIKGPFQGPCTFLLKRILRIIGVFWRAV